jgi:signal transduction histidine kinase
VKLSVRPRVVAFCLVVLWGIATASIFVELVRRTERQIENQAKTWGNNFVSNWVIEPDNQRNLFRTMEEDFFSDLRRNEQAFSEVALTWIHPSSGETILYPTERIGQKMEGWKGPDWISIPIREPYDDSKDYGYLYFRLDPWDRWLTTLTFLLAAVNVLMLSLLLLSWLTRLSRRYEASQSEIRQKNEQLVQLEQLALAGRLSAGLLHDLKKPVIHIREECVEEKGPGTLRDIREQSELFLSMVRDSGLEGFARSRSEGNEFCDVIEVVERSLRLVQYEREDVEVELKTEGNVPLVWAHPTRLMQVYSNLILNAYQAMKGRGKLVVEIRGESRESGERQAVVEVRDSGPGVPDEAKEKIFEPFYTTGKEGSGLGLYIIQTILEGLGGSISVETAPEGGACFRVKLPEGK